MGLVRIGISGWTYEPWRGNFYPDGLPQRLELAYATRRFSTLEINGTFYSLQRPSSFRDWYVQTPAGFVFSIKGSRYITHLRRLKDVRTPLANFLASGLLELREKLGPILWQFPPTMKLDLRRFRAFLEMLPRDSRELARLGAEYDSRLKEPPALEFDANRPVRHAIEFRHESFLTPAFVELLREFNVSIVVADAASKFPASEEVTADFVYIRLHGSRKLYVSGYTPRELDGWAGKIRGWSKRGDVYVYFDNTDIKLRAPVDARSLARRLDVLVPGTPAQLVRALTKDVPTGRDAPRHSGRTVPESPAVEVSPPEISTPLRTRARRR